VSRKPNSVPPPPACANVTDDDHSSSPAIAGGIEQPTRRLRTGRPVAPPYLVLLRAGFCLPPVLPRARCALTAPFHPYFRRTGWSAECPESPGHLDGVARPELGAALLRRSTGPTEAVSFLCHCPSGHPDRALPGALPCGVRTFLPAFASCGASARRSSGSLRTTIVPRDSSEPPSARRRLASLTGRNATMYGHVERLAGTFVDEAAVREREFEARLAESSTLAHG
jgi:hypothetical protein